MRHDEPGRLSFPAKPISAFLQRASCHWIKLPPILRQPLSGLARATADFIFPPLCLSCRKAIANSGALCPQCWDRVRFIERPYCERLGTPFSADLGQEGLLSPEAVANPPVFGRARAVAQFDEGPVRHLVHRLKYGDRLEIARPLGLWMARAGAELLNDADVLLPIPLHWRRLLKRRYNQANVLARSISSHCGVPVEPFLLERVKPTVTQVRLTRSQRALNLQGAFNVPEEARPRVEGRAIVLIDDVLTSGATLNAAARVLLRHRAARVDVLVFARVL